MPLNAFDSGCRYLTYRPHTEKELKDKLSKKGFATNDISNAVKRLKDLGYINDEDVAMRWVQSKVKQKCWGISKITAYLINKGVSRDIINRVVKTVLNEIPEENIAKEALRKKFGDNPLSVSAKKIAFFLNSRGFTPEIIYKIIGEQKTD